MLEYILVEDIDVKRREERRREEMSIYVMTTVRVISRSSALEMIGRGWTIKGRSSRKVSPLGMSRYAIVLDH